MLAGNEGAARRLGTTPGDAERGDGVAHPGFKLENIADVAEVRLSLRRAHARPYGGRGVAVRSAPSEDCLMSPPASVSGVWASRVPRDAHVSHAGRIAHCAAIDQIAGPTSTQSPLPPYFCVPFICL